MNILVVTHYYSTHAGGIEIVAGRLVSELAASHDLAWAASDCDAAPALPSGVRLLAMRSFNGVEKVTGLPFPLWGIGSLVRLWRAVGAADVVHMHDVVYAGNWAAFVFARLRRRPIVLTQHAGLIQYRSAVLALMLRTMHRTVGRLLLRGANQVVFVSPVVREYYQGFVHFTRPPEIVYNGVDGDLYTAGTAADRAQARVQFGFDPSQPVVLFVGRFVEAKGLPLVERLARGLPAVTFALAGWGPIDPRTWKLSNVHVFSGLRGATLVPLYRAADLLVLPSLGEGLPLVVQEALACGTPALVDPETARAVGAPADAVRGCPTMGADAVETWTAAVRGWLGEPTSGGDSRDARARLARDRWSWSAAAARYSEIFRGVSAAQARGPAR
jgi:glycosyltransferase involved in cell wall biosynthesis